MPKNFKATPNIRETIPAAKVHQAIDDLTDFILEHFQSKLDNLALVGIHTRGALIAERIAQKIKAKRGLEVPVGALDITLYRDDFGTDGVQPVIGETQLDFDIDDKQIVLVDDVLFTGRTIRAALDEIIDFGRPKHISLVVLVDRGHPELPIQPDFTAIKIPTKRAESVVLHLDEIDQQEDILICEAIDHE